MKNIIFNSILLILIICIFPFLLISCGLGKIAMPTVSKPNIFGNTQSNYNYSPPVAIQDNYMYFRQTSGFLGLKTTICRKDLSTNKVVNVLKGDKLGYLSVQGDWIYYLSQAGIGVPGACSLWKCKLDGTCNTNLLKNESIVDYQIYKDNIYFSVENGNDETGALKHLLKQSDLNGNNIQTIFSLNFRRFTLSDDGIFVTVPNNDSTEIVSINLINKSQSLIYRTTTDSYMFYDDAFIYFEENTNIGFQICRVNKYNGMYEVLYKSKSHDAWEPFYKSNENLIFEDVNGINVLKIGTSTPKFLVKEKNGNEQLQNFCVFGDKIYFYQTFILYECDINTGKIIKIK